MPIVVNSNVTATTASFNLSSANDALRNSLARLSSGKRIVNPADDAGGMAVASKLNSRLTRTSAVRQNNHNALSYLQVQDGALSTIGNIMGRMSELRTMANDVTKNSSDVENYSKEFVELQSEILQISSMQFNGVSLFTLNHAARKEGILQRVDDDIEYNDVYYNKFSRITTTHEDGGNESGHVSISVINLSQMIPFLRSGLTTTDGSDGFPTDGAGVGVGISFTFSIDDGVITSDNIYASGSGYSIGDKVWSPTSPGNWFAGVTDASIVWNVTSVDGSGGITGIARESGDASDHDWWYPGFVAGSGLSNSHENIASLSIGTFVDAIERIADARAENGAEQNRLKFVDNILGEKQTNLEAAHGRIMDADIALESTRFARQNVLVQSSAAMVAQANQLTSIALTILG